MPVSRAGWWQDREKKGSRLLALCGCSSLLREGGSLAQGPWGAPSELLGGWGAKEQMGDILKWMGFLTFSEQRDPTGAP